MNPMLLPAAENGNRTKMAASDNQNKTPEPRDTSKESHAEHSRQDVPKIVISPPPDKAVGGNCQQQQHPGGTQERLAAFSRDISTMATAKPLPQDAMPIARMTPVPEPPKKWYGRASVSPKLPSALLSLYIDSENDQGSDGNNNDLTSSTLDELPLFILDPSDEIQLRARGVLVGGINGDRFTINQSIGGFDHGKQAEQAQDEQDEEGGEKEHEETGGERAGSSNSSIPPPTDPDDLPAEYPRAIGSIACFEFLGFERPKAAQLAHRFITNVYMDQFLLLPLQLIGYPAAATDRWRGQQRRRWWRQVEMDALDVLDECETPDIRGQGQHGGDKHNLNSGGRSNGAGAGAAGGNGDSALEPEVDPFALEALMEALHLNLESRMVLRELAESRCLFADDMSVKDWAHDIVTAGICELEQLALQSEAFGHAAQIAKARAALDEEDGGYDGGDEQDMQDEEDLQDEEDIQDEDHQEDTENDGKTSDQDMGQQDRMRAASEAVDTEMLSLWNSIDNSPSNGHEGHQESSLSGSDGDNVNSSRQEDVLSLSSVLKAAIRENDGGSLNPSSPMETIQKLDRGIQKLEDDLKRYEINRQKAQIALQRFESMSLGPALATHGHYEMAEEAFMGHTEQASRDGNEGRDDSHSEACHTMRSVEKGSGGMGKQADEGPEGNYSPSGSPPKKRKLDKGKYVGCSE